MNTALQTHRAPKASEKKIDLPGLEVTIDSVQLPDTVVTETIVASANTGRKTSSKTTEIPFSAGLTIDKTSNFIALSALGIENFPIKDVSAALQVGDGSKPELLITLRSHYTAREAVQRSEEVATRYHPTGQHTPYGPKDSPGYWDYETRHWTEMVDVERTEAISGAKLNGQGFGALYLALLNSPGGSKKEELLDFLHRTLPKQCEEAQSWISAKVEEKVEAARCDLEKQTAKLSELKLPPLKRG